LTAILVSRVSTPSLIDPESGRSALSAPSRTTRGRFESDQPEELEPRAVTDSELHNAEIERLAPSHLHFFSRRLHRC
jgi:hypothetical protein